MRLAGQGVCLLLLLAGLHVVGASIDYIPYVGSPQFDYFPMDYGRPFWPQLIAQDLPVLLTGLLVSVFCLTGLRGKFPRRLTPPAALRVWGGWAAAMLALRMIWHASLWWPPELSEIGWALRYATVNAVVSASLLTAALWLAGRYAGWSARPRRRWAEAVLWFAVSAILLAAFNVAMTMAGGVRADRLFSDTWQMALFLGGVLALAVALAPRSPPVGPEGLEPPTRPL